MFPVAPKRGWMAPTVSGAHSCQLHSLSRLSLANTLWHSKKNLNFWVCFCLHLSKTRKLGEIVQAQDKCCVVGAWLRCDFQHTERCVGLSVSSELKTHFCLLHNSKRCLLTFHVTEGDKTGLRLRNYLWNEYVLFPIHKGWLWRDIST